MTSKQVKEVKVSNGIRTTYFTDDSKLVEQLFDAKLVSGKPTSRLTDNTADQNVSLGFDVIIDETDEKFNALVYENYLNTVRETNPDAFGEGDSVVLAISVAKNRDGIWTKFGRLSLPEVFASNDVIDDSMLDDVLAEMNKKSFKIEDEVTILSNEKADKEERSDFYDNSKDDDSYSDSNLKDDFGLDTQNKTSKYRDGPLLVMMVITFIGIILILQPLYHVFGEFLYVIAVFATVGAIKLIEPLFKKQ